MHPAYGVGIIFPEESRPPGPTDDLVPMNTYTLTTAVFCVLGYLLGSIPFGLLLTWAAGLGDIRSIGSGNIGATNVLRTGRKSLAAMTLVLDALKGIAAVLIARRWGSESIALLSGLCAVL